MANQEHLDVLLQGVHAWNRWRAEASTIQPDLSEANLAGRNLTWVHLAGAELRGTELRGAELYGANLRRANLREADLYLANLADADLHEANLIKAHLAGADLRGANLHKADLAGADLDVADLRRANLQEANLTGADLYAADLSEAILIEANLTGASLNETTLSKTICVLTNFSSAVLTGCSVYGIVAKDVNLNGTSVADLRLALWGAAPWGEDSTLTVDNLEVAQFFSGLLQDQKMRDTLDTITSKVVLIIGRFSDRSKPVLNALREAIRGHPNGYVPALLDFESKTDEPEVKMITTIANFARFVIADVSDPDTVRDTLSVIIPNAPTVPIQLIADLDVIVNDSMNWKSHSSILSECTSWESYPSVLPVYWYADLSQLLANLTESVITPVEAHVQARRL